MMRMAIRLKEPGYGRMGEQNVKLLNDEATGQAFMRSLLVEVHALERMLEDGLIESGIRRIGHLASFPERLLEGALGKWGAATSIRCRKRSKLRNETPIPDS